MWQNGGLKDGSNREHGGGCWEDGCEGQEEEQDRDDEKQVEKLLFALSLDWDILKENVEYFKHGIMDKRRDQWLFNSNQPNSPIFFSYIFSSYKTYTLLSKQKLKVKLKIVVIKYLGIYENVHFVVVNDIKRLKTELNHTVIIE